MAKKTVKKKRSQEADNDIWGSLSVFFTNERLRFLVGLLLCFAVIYVSIAMASFFKDGRELRIAVSGKSGCGNTTSSLLARSQIGRAHV